MENINEQNIVDEIKSVLQSEYYVQQELNDEQIKEVIKIGRASCRERV